MLYHFFLNLAHSLHLLGLQWFFWLRILGVTVPKYLKGIISSLVSFMCCKATELLSGDVYIMVAPTVRRSKT